MRGLERVVVHPVDHSGVHVRAAGGGDDHLLRAALQVFRRLVLAREQPGALVHDIHPEFPPRQLRRVALGEDLDPVAVDHQRIALDLDLAGEAAVGGVVAGEMGVGLGVAEVVDRDDADLVGAPALVEGAEDVAADAPETVDAYLDRHVRFSMSVTQPGGLSANVCAYRASVLESVHPRPSPPIRPSPSCLRSRTPPSPPRSRRSSRSARRGPGTARTSRTYRPRRPRRPRPRKRASRR